MDKAWMYIEDRLHSSEYVEGVKQFIDVAKGHAPGRDCIRCPCRRCRNRTFHSIGVVQDHLFIIGIGTSYTAWILHGEEEILLEATDSEEEVPHAYNYNDYIDDVDEMLDDIQVGSFMDNSAGTELNLDEGPSKHNADDPIHTTFEELLENARKRLYPSCTNFSQLSFIVKLLHIKTVGGWTVKSFDMVIKLLQAAFPHALFSASFQDACHLQQGLGFGYTKIHVCPNDCTLFWKGHTDKDECLKCNESRWASMPAIQQRKPQKVL